jgi:hypothetical protein
MSLEANYVQSVPFSAIDFATLAAADGADGHDCISWYEAFVGWPIH